MPNHVTTQITGPTAILDALTRTHTEAERAAFDASEDERKERLAELGRGREFIREHLDMTERIVDFGMVIPEPDNIEQGRAAVSTSLASSAGTSGTSTTGGRSGTGTRFTRLITATALPRSGSRRHGRTRSPSSRRSLARSRTPNCPSPTPTKTSAATSAGT